MNDALPGRFAQTPAGQAGAGETLIPRRTK